MQIFYILSLLHLVQVIQIKSSSIPPPTVTTAAHAHDHAHAHRSTSSEMKMRGGEKTTRKPCGFFVWDVMSASRYHVCIRLLRESVYEGLGGKKFLRMKQGSVLASLYPLSMHGPDRCLICNQSFHRHLMTWWFPKRYTPYDLYLDGVNKECSSSDSLESSHCDAEQQTPAVTPPNILAYHRLYIKNIISPRHPPSLDDKSNTLKTKKREQNKKKSTITSDDLSSSPDNYETRESGGVRYTVPNINANKNMGMFQSLILTVARDIVLMDLDDLMFSQRLENNFNEWKERFNPDLIMR